MTDSNQSQSDQESDREPDGLPDGQEPAMAELAIDQHLDVTGLSCPMPLLKAKQALNRLPAGALLEVRATDPGSERDFEVFARQSGHGLLVSQRQQEQFVYVLRKKD